MKDTIESLKSKWKPKHSRVSIVIGLSAFMLMFSVSGVIATEKVGQDEWLIYGDGEELPGTYWGDWQGDTQNFSLNVLSGPPTGTAIITTDRSPATDNITAVTAYVEMVNVNTGSNSAQFAVVGSNGYIVEFTYNMNFGEIKFDHGSGDTVSSWGQNAGHIYKIEMTNIDYSANTLDVTATNTTTGTVELSDSGVSFGNSNSGIDSISLSAGGDNDIKIHNITVTNAGRILRYEVNGDVTSSENGTEITDATIDFPSLNEAVEVDNTGYYRTSVPNGTYEVTATAPGYANQTETVTVAGEIETQDFQLRPESQSLDIETRRHLEHGETAEYTVTFRNLSGGQTNSSDVTAMANVTSLNTSIITINDNRELVIGTNDTSINARTKIKAEYQSGGTNYTATQNVTVANLTANNLKILPTGARLEAALEGGLDSNRNNRTVVVILIATLFGVAAAILATSFAGVAIMSLTMIAGWLGGWVGNGMVMVAILTGLFIGLNVAANIDYSTIRTGD